ncbi:MAG TPA: nitroreductase family protein, partial [Bordetella sp.]
MTATHSVTEQALLARYGSDALPGPLNDIAAQLLEHRSVRSYADKPVSDEILRVSIAAAQSASTSSNLQVWSVVAVRDRAKLAKLGDLAGGQQHVINAPLFLAWVLDLSRLRRLGDALGVPTKGTDYLEMYTTGAVDVALAAQNAAVALESYGLGLVYIGGMRNHPEDVAELLGLPQGSMVLFGMCVGYPDPALPADIKPRLPQSSVLHFERYDAANETAEVQDYDARMDAFNESQARKTRPWSQLATHRVRGPESLSG